jgi:hypothetical protein
MVHSTFCEYMLRRVGNHDILEKQLFATELAEQLANGQWQ